MTDTIPKPTKREFTDDDTWLERFLTPRLATEKCCPKCQAGPIPGQFPCGRPKSCPNTNCVHSRK